MSVKSFLLEDTEVGSVKESPIRCHYTDSIMSLLEYVFLTKPFVSQYFLTALGLAIDDPAQNCLSHQRKTELSLGE